MDCISSTNEAFSQKKKKTAKENFRPELDQVAGLRSISL